MGSFDRNYSQDFYAAQRPLKPDVGPSVLGDLARAAFVAPLFVAGAVAATSAETVVARAKMVRSSANRTIASLRRFAQEMSDEGEVVDKRRSLASFASYPGALLDKAVQITPITIDVNPVSLSSERSRKIGGIGLLSAFGAEAWQAVPHHLDVNPTVPITPLPEEQK